MPTTAEILHFDDPSPDDPDPWVVRPEPERVELADHDPAWATQAAELSARIADALGMRALRIEHVGSTSVPGLPAKPVIDLDVTVADPDDEARWLPALESAGLILAVREPWWHGHRCLRGTAPQANVHVFGPDSPELVKHIVFRNWLRQDAADRGRYAAAKRAAAGAGDRDGMMLMEDYNARKQAVIREIYDRAFLAAGFLDGADH